MIEVSTLVDSSAYSGRLLLRRRAVVLFLLVFLVTGLVVARSNFVDYGQLLDSYDEVKLAAESSADALALGGEVLDPEQTERVLGVYERQLSERSAVLDSTRSWRVAVSLFGSLALAISLISGALLSGWDRRPGLAFLSLAVNRGRRGLFASRVLTSVVVSVVFMLVGIPTYQLLAWRYSRLYQPFATDNAPLDQLNSIALPPWLIVLGFLIAFAVFASLGSVASTIFRSPAIGASVAVGFLALDQVLRRGYSWYEGIALNGGVAAITDPSWTVSSAVTTNLWPFLSVGGTTEADLTAILPVVWLLPLTMLASRLSMKSDLQVG